MFSFFMPIVVGIISHLCHLFVPQNWLASTFTILIVAGMCIFGIADYKKGQRKFIQALNWLCERNSDNPIILKGARELEVFSRSYDSVLEVIKQLILGV